MSRVYGSLVNRFEEGKNFNKDKQIHIGDDITMYFYSDRECLYVTDVIDQKHIKVKHYYVVADHDKDLGMGHQEWLYFKTRREENDYLSKYHPEMYIKDIEEDPEETWVFRYGKWKRVFSYTLKSIEESIKKYSVFNWCIFTDKEMEKLNNGGEVTKYFDLSGKVSFGRRDYHYDWSF